jgi:precorrin-6Y C5,15-methyltransferase (decarboxylating)
VERFVLTVVGPDNPAPAVIPVSVVGMGMSQADLTERHLGIIHNAQVLVGGRRHLEAFADLDVETRIVDRHLAELTIFIRDRMTHKRVVVLASGDPLYYGIGAYLITELGREAVRVYPNITAVAAAFARLGEPWQDIAVASLHGRDHLKQVLSALHRSKRVAVFTDSRQTPAWLARTLLDSGRTDLRICVLEHMGSDREQVGWWDLGTASKMDFSEPNLVVLLSSPVDGVSTPKAPVWIGMPEERFDHQEGLITKAEIRAVSLAKLRLGPGLVLWDLGAGSGAVGIEAASLVPGGLVTAVEKDPHRAAQITANRDRLGIVNHRTVQATLPGAMAALPDPDRIFVGGGGGRLSEILSNAMDRLRPEGVIVVNSVVLENFESARKSLADRGFDPEVVQVQVNRGAPIADGIRLKSENPVWIVTGIKPPEVEKETPGTGVIP